MERLKVPIEPHEVRVQRIFDMGHGVHSRIEQELIDAGVMVKSEAPVSAPDHNLKGHTDGIGVINIPDLGGVMVIIEIKSCGVNAWKFMVGNLRWAGKGPKREHVWQVQLYMYMSGINYSILIYENKNTQERKYYVIKRDIELINNVLLPRVDLINDHVLKKTLPNRDEEHQDPGKDGKTPMECNYCPYVKVCKAEENMSFPDLIELGYELI